MRLLLVTRQPQAIVFNFRIALQMDLTHIGLLLGLFGAACQALNYAVTKDVQQKYTLGGLKLLSATHVMMFICVIIPFVLCAHYEYIDKYSVFYS